MVAATPDAVAVGTLPVAWADWAEAGAKPVGSPQGPVPQGDTPHPAGELDTPAVVGARAVPAADAAFGVAKLVPTDVLKCRVDRLVIGMD